MLKVEDFIKENNIPITIVPEETNYWLVRTQSGEYYEEFFHDNFIGINWDEFSDLDILKNTEKDEIIEEIKNTYRNVDADKQPHAGRIYGQIYRFCFELSIGDIVMIPSSNSSHISFGMITSETYIETVSETLIEEGACPFKKRRAVEWIKTVPRNKLDPYLYRMMQAHQTISNASEYAKYIDRTLHSFYLKGNQAYFVVDVKQTKDIPALDIVEYVSSALDLVPLIRKPEQPKEHYKKEDVDLKLNVQSPGLIVFTAAAAPYLIMILGAALVILFSSKIKLRDNDQEDELLEKFVEKDLEKLQQIQTRQKISGTNLKIEVPKEITKKLDLK